MGVQYTINDLSELGFGRVILITNQELAPRMYCLGLAPGSMVQLVRKQSGKGSVYIRVKSTALALRNEEANTIIIEKISSGF